ncbi:MAG: peptidase M42 family protein [Chloroflexi bacterium OLB15]|nr:MAG: peptidase M42 family protein [Chloroflexi bacterium OLB15]
MPTPLDDQLLENAIEQTLPMLTQLLNTPSPTGYTREAIRFCRESFTALDLPLSVFETRKGALMMPLKGKSAQIHRAVTAHVDTLGAMVKDVKPSGRLKFAMLGGSPWTAVEYEGVTVRTAKDERIRGTIVPVNGSTHVNKDAATMPRNENTLEIRLDARTRSGAETVALGIAPGDFIFFDPRVELGEAGFIRSRHLDDKLCVAAIYAALIALKDGGLIGQIAYDTLLNISNYEEVGHGGRADWPDEMDELLVVDMAAMGDGQWSDEFSVTLCIRDSGGPYSFEMNENLRRLAAEAGIPLKTDLYPNYSSDGTAYWGAGGAARVALIGMGVDSSHGYERSHRDGLKHTTHLIAQYLLGE